MAFELNERNHQDAQKQDHCLGRSNAKLEILECIGKYLQDQYGSGPSRPSLGHDVHRRKDLEGIDDAHDRYVKRNRSQLGNRNMDETTETIATIKGCRFIQGVIDTPKTCKVDDHIVSDTLPDNHDHDRGQSPMRIRKPRRNIHKTKCAEKIIQDTILCIQELPDNGDCYDRGNMRKEKSRSQRRGEFYATIQDNSHDQGKEYDQGYCPNCINNGIPEGNRKTRILEQVYIVSQTYEYRGAGTIPFRETETNCPDHRNQGKYCKPKEIRQKKKESCLSIPVDYPV